MYDITGMSRGEKFRMLRETEEAAAQIDLLTPAHIDTYSFRAADLLADVIDHGIAPETITNAVAFRIHEIPDEWDQRIDREVYAWADEQYADRGRPWDIGISMHPVYLNAFAREIMKTLRA